MTARARDRAARRGDTAARGGWRAMAARGVAAMSAAMTAAGCATAQPATQPQQPFAAAITIHFEGGTPVNRRILGNNVQWIDRGDGLLQPGSTEFAPQLLRVLAGLPMPVLRYPGGSLADLYDWRAGTGPLASRGEGRHSHQDRRERIAFGTREFLELCARLGADPMITVNIASGTPEEAAEWVRLTNVTRVRAADGSVLPTVRLWEIGNEPYLRLDVHPQLTRPPAEVAQTIDRFISAMRAVDPSIEVIVPLRSDAIGGVPATPLQGYNAAILAGVRERYEHVAVHNAYLPYVAAGRVPDDPGLFRALMAAPLVVERDLDATRAAVARARPGQRVGLAVTEYNSLVTLGRGRTDAYIASHAGALYIADLLRMFAEEDVDLANYWSLNGNWHFGAMSSRGEPRPAFHVLAAYDVLLRGMRLPVEVRSPTFDAPAAGWVPRLSGVPTVTALATRAGDTLRVLVINKSPGAPAEVSLQIPPGHPFRVRAASQLAARHFFDVPSGAAPGWQPVALAPSAGRVTVPPHAMLQLEVLLGAAARDGPAAP